MNIVHVEDFFHPDAGYQVNLLSRLQRAQGHQVTVVTAELAKVPEFITGFFGKDRVSEKDIAFESETGVSVIRIPLLGYYSGRVVFKPRLFKAVAGVKPDVVFVHGEDTLTGMLFILFSSWLRYPIVLDCHMLEMASLNRFRHYFRALYRRLLTPIILRNEIPLIRVVDSDFVEKCLGIPLAYTDLLSFGTDTSHFAPDESRRHAVRKEYGLDETKFCVLYAGKLDDTKGGRFLADALKERLAPISNRTIEFMIIGNSVGSYGDEVEAVFRLSENRIIRLPTQRYFDLAQYYQAADLIVFPRQCSMSFFEAQSCGLPVLFEENEINCGRAVSGNAFTFDPENAKDFRAKILWLASLPKERYDEIGKNGRDYVLQNCDYVPIARRFTEVLERAVSGWQARGGARGWS